MIDEHNQLSLLKEQFNSFEHIGKKTKTELSLFTPQFAKNL